ncbi:MAG: hypothetical protein RLY23_214 [Actinomycetota bacterium]|jgi:uncharacterized protein (TIGR01777 family)
MEIAVTGASGLIGSALIAALEAEGHRVRRFVRGGAAISGNIAWDPIAGTIESGGLDGVEAVVHLAGEGIGEKRWNAEQKERIRSSRTLGTELIARSVAAMTKPPRVLLSASAIGWYGNRGDEVLTESSSAPEPPDFLSEVCVDWEAAAAPAVDAGIRTVLLRTGIVLTPKGGALGRMITPFRLGLGGKIASGKQWMSWISLEDEIQAILHVLRDDSVSGPVNLTAPAPVTNLEFTKALGKAVHRPTILPTPLAPLKLALGAELITALLVNGQRVLPSALEASGYRFRHPDIASAFASIL